MHIDRGSIERMYFHVERQNSDTGAMGPKVNGSFYEFERHSFRSPALPTRYFGKVLSYPSDDTHIFR
jgi:hypothetical protein